MRPGNAVAWSVICAPAGVGAAAATTSALVVSAHAVSAPNHRPPPRPTPRIALIPHVPLATGGGSLPLGYSLSTRASGHRHQASRARAVQGRQTEGDRKSTRLNSSHVEISY